MCTVGLGYVRCSEIKISIDLGKLSPGDSQDTVISTCVLLDSEMTAVKLVGSSATVLKQGIHYTENALIFT